MTVKAATVSALILCAAVCSAQATKAWGVKIPGLSEGYADSGFFAFGGEDKKWSIYEARSGKKLVDFEACEAVRLQRTRAMVALAKETQIWDLSARKLAYRVPVSGIKLGALVEDSFFYLKEGQLTRWDLAAGKSVDQRGVPTTQSRWPVRTNGKRVFVDPGRHEVLGLNPGDLSQGWRSYCDSFVATPYDDCTLMYSKLGFGLSMLDDQGKKTIMPEMEKGYMQSIRQVPARTGNIVAQGGMWVIENNVLVSPCFFGAELPSGKLIWKKPMIATSPVSVAGKFAVIESHGDWGIYSAKLHETQSQVILVNPADGKTIAKIGPRFVPKRSEQPWLAATDDILCFMHRGSVTAFRIR